MSGAPGSAAKPRNPYGPALVVLGVLFVAGPIMISALGVGSRPQPSIGIFLPGVMMMTISVIMFFGAYYGWKGFEKRFGSESLRGQWEVPGRQWKEHLEKEKGRLVKRGFFAGVILPGLVVGVILFLGSRDGKLEDVLPITLMVGGALVIVVWTIVMLQWFALSGNQGLVWVAERGLLVNRVTFFIDGFGIRTRSRELCREGDEHHLKISYQVNTGRGMVDHELVVPVPEDRLEMMTKTLETWEANSPTRDRES